MYRIILFLSVSFFVFSCGNAEKPIADTPLKTATAPTPPKPVAQQLYPSIPVEKIQSLWENCDYIDFTLDDYPTVSMNRSETRDKQHSLAMIAAQPALVNPSCSPFGTALFYQNGDLALEARIYFSQGCNYFVFMENNQPKYANFMTSSGVTFFNDIVSKFSKLGKN